MCVWSGCAVELAMKYVWMKNKCIVCSYVHLHVFMYLCVYVCACMCVCIHVCARVCVRCPTGRDGVALWSPAVQCDVTFAEREREKRDILYSFLSLSSLDRESERVCERGVHMRERRERDW